MASLQSMGNDVKALGVVGISIGILLAILQGIVDSNALLGSNTSVATTANTTVGTLITKIGTLGNWFGIIVLVIIGAYLLGAFDRFK